MWRHVAPALARDHTVVVPDLRGYGASDKPTPDADNRRYAKRAMADDQVAVMRSLGFDRFDLVGHDRGARVAHRLTLDHPEAVSRLAVLDIVPTRHVFSHVDRTLAHGYFHWFLLSTGGGVPETLLAGAPEFWIRVDGRAAPRARRRRSADEVMDRVHRATSPTRPAIAATTADYRAGATSDLDDDEASCDAGDARHVPAAGAVGRGVVRREGLRAARGVAGVRLRRAGVSHARGHFMPEEAPEQVVAELRAFGM